MIWEIDELTGASLSVRIITFKVQDSTKGSYKLCDDCVIS